jgi:hypothetical protein
MTNAYNILYGYVPEIYDWYKSVGPEISSYTPEQAYAETDEWHRMMAGKGEGKIYEPTKPELIVYGPEWKNPEWQGWTIQKVMSENDLLTEGSTDNMNHCVGDYPEEVAAGYMIIYSLRDPKNNPHATMETDDFHNVRQIKGKGNSIPKKEYQIMIKEWIESDKNTMIEGYSDDSDPFEELNTSYGTAEDILHAIEQASNDDYGLQRNIETDAVDIMNMSISMMNRSREPSYWGDWTDIPRASIDMILKTTNMASDAWQADQIKALEKELYKKEEEIWDYAYSHWDMSYTGESDEENPMQEDSDYMAEEIRKTPSGGYAHDGISYINQLREQGLIPKPQTKQPQASSINWYKKAKQ